MAVFKKHVTFGFWKSRLMDDFDKLFQRGPKSSPMGARVESLADLPAKNVLVAYVREAKRLNDEGVKEPVRAKPKRSPDVDVPLDLTAALKKNAKAKKAFEAFSPSHKREYVEWITEAKRDETRAKRLATTLEWLVEGKHRNWKYERC